jgi:hypothetical protein
VYTERVVFGGEGKARWSEAQFQGDVADAWDSNGAFVSLGEAYRSGAVDRWPTDEWSWRQQPGRLHASDMSKQVLGILAILSIAESSAQAERPASERPVLRDRPSFVEARGRIAEAPPAEEVLRGFEPQFEKAAHSCRSGEEGVPGDVIIAVKLEADRLPRFDLDVSRSLGPRVGRCLKQRFRPIVAAFMQNVEIVSYVIHDVIEVWPGSPFSDLDLSLLRPGAREGRRRLPPDISLGPPGCFRIRGTPAFSSALEHWLNRTGKRLSSRSYEENAAGQLGISHRELTGVWLHAGTSLLVWSADGKEPAESWPPLRLCQVSLDRLALPPAALPQ